MRQVATKPRLELGNEAKALKIETRKLGVFLLQMPLQ